MNPIMHYRLVLQALDELSELIPNALTLELKLRELIHQEREKNNKK